MQDNERTGVPVDDGFVRHPIRTAVHEAEHLHELADEGESAATPAILGLAAVAVVLPVAAILVTAVFVIAHLV